MAKWLGDARAWCSLARIVVVELSRHSFSRRKLRAYARSEEAESRRAETEAKIRDLIAGLGEVEGLEPVLTRFSDTCAKGPARNPFDARSQKVMSCGASGLRAKDAFPFPAEAGDTHARSRMELCR